MNDDIIIDDSQRYFLSCLFGTSQCHSLSSAQELSILVVVWHEKDEIVCSPFE